MDYFRQIANCYKTGIVSDKFNEHVKPQLAKIDSTKNLLELLEDKGLRQYFTCTDNRIMFVSAIVALYILALVYNNKIAYIPNKNITKIEHWAFVLLASYITLNYVLGENVIISIILSCVIAYLYNYYVPKRVPTSANMHEGMINLNNDNLSCTCTCTNKDNTEKSSDIDMESYVPIEEKNIQQAKNNDLKIAEDIINQGEELIVQAEDAKEQAALMSKKGINTVAADLVVKSTEMEKEGAKMILTGEKIKAVSAEQDAKVMVKEGKKQVSKGKKDIIQGKELVRIGEDNIGKQLITQGTIIKENGKALIATGKHIKKETTAKIKEIDNHKANIEGVSDTSVLKILNETNDSVNNTIMVAADGNITTIPSVEEDDEILPSSTMVVSNNIKSAGVPTIDDIIDAEISMTPDVSGTILQTPQISEDKKSKMIAKGQNDVVKGEIIINKGKTLLKKGDYINGNKLVQKGQTLQNTGNELIQSAGLIECVGKKYGINNVNASNIQKIDGLVSGYDVEDNLASF